MVVHSEKEINEVGWLAPKAISFGFEGVAADATDASVLDKSASIVKAKCLGDLETLVQRVVVMGEIPGVVKTIAGTVSGTKPLIYQYVDHLELEIFSEQAGTESTKAKGLAWTEVTFTLSLDN